MQQPDLSDTEFTASDFGVDGLSEEELRAYRCDLDCVYYSVTRMLVASQRQGTDPHVVGHDYTNPRTCDCQHYYFRNVCKSHFLRVQLVLDRRNARLQREQKAMQREGAPLNGNRGFDIFR